ncbi:MAG: metallophosphoesterase [Solirubrobacterales bacterium]|nr:metallophosphoesterase [Solirubrobacterales bacterium]
MVPGRIVAIIAAGLLAGLGALWTFTQERDLSVGRVELSVEPFHHGALDIYVPVVDWGVRFGGVRLPARLHVEVRAIDRSAASAVATGDPTRVEVVRAEARDAIASYLRWTVAATAAAALAGSALMVLILRAPVRLLALALAPMLVWAGAIAFLLAPRGQLDAPQYYAHGPDIPVALKAVQSATRSSAHLGQVVDDQLVGLARLVALGEQRTLKGLPRLTIASDLHNNVLALDALSRAAEGGIVLFPGDLTDSGTPLEASVLAQVASEGRAFVFTTGNHDSDTLALALARRGAVVLTEAGRLLRNGRHGPVVTTVGGLRIAGYSSPNERRAQDGFADNGAAVDLHEQADFERWLLGLAGKVDVVLVHEPQLAAPAIAAWRVRHPDEHLLVAVGHTHEQDVNAAGSVVEVNGGTLGAGGTGNLGEGQDVGLAVATIRPRPFLAVAVDLVQIDPGDGSATATRVRVDGARAQAP